MKVRYLGKLSNTFKHLGVTLSTGQVGEFKEKTALELMNFFPGQFELVLDSVEKYKKPQYNKKAKKTDLFQTK